MGPARPGGMLGVGFQSDLLSLLLSRCFLLVELKGLLFFFGCVRPQKYASHRSPVRVFSSVHMDGFGLITRELEKKDIAVRLGC